MISPCRFAEEINRQIREHELCDYRSDSVSRLYLRIRALAIDAAAEHTETCETCAAIAEAEAKDGR